jgi:hypothetical protein
VFHSGIRPGRGGLCPPPPGERLGPRENVTKKFFWGFAPDFIVGSGGGGVFRGSVRAIGEEKNFCLRVCVGVGRAGRTKRFEEVDEGRSDDWLEIGEMSKRRSSKNFTSTFGVRRCPCENARNFFIRPSGDPIPRPPSGLQL